MKKMLALAFALILTSVTSFAQIGLPWPGPGGVSTSPASFACDLTVGGCGVAYSYNRALVNGYVGPLFQVQYGPPTTPTGTFDVSQATPYADIAAHCAGPNADACTYHTWYDQTGGCNLNAVSGLGTLATETDPPINLNPVNGQFRFWRPSDTNGTPIEINNRFFYEYAFRYGGASGTTPCAHITATGNADISTTMVGEDGFFDSCCSAVGVEDTSASVLVIGSGWSLGWRGTTRATIDCETDIDYFDYTSTPPQLYRGMGTYHGGSVTSDFWINGTEVHTGTAACAYKFSDFSPSGFTGPRVGQAGIVGPDAGDNTREPGGKHYEFAVFNHAALNAETTNIQTNQNTFYTTNRPTPTGVRGLLNLFEVIPLVNSAFLDSVGASSPGVRYPEEHGWSFRLLNGYYTAPVMRVRNGTTNNEFDITPLAGQADVTTALQAGNGTTGGPGCTTDNTTTTCFVTKIYDQVLMGGIIVAQATAGNQPQVWFSASPNGKTAMKCSGTQSLTSGTTQPTAADNIFGTPDNTIIVSGERTGAFTSLSGLFDSNGSGVFVGFDSVANQAYEQPPSFHGGLTASATDSTWHNMIAAHGGAGDANFAVDTGTLPVATVATATNATLPVSFCGNPTSGFNFLTGFWGEAIVLTGGEGGVVGRANSATIHTNQAAYW